MYREDGQQENMKGWQGSRRTDGLSVTGRRKVGRTKARAQKHLKKEHRAMHGTNAWSTVH